MAEGWVRISTSGRGIAKVTLDGEKVRGEGGAHDPRLVLPLAFVFTQRPREAALAITELECSLHLVPMNQGATDANCLGSPVRVSLITEGFISQPDYLMDRSRFQNRFSSSAEGVAQSGLPQEVMTR